MKLTNQDRMVAVSIAVGAIVVALLFYGLITDWFGLFGFEYAPVVGT